jgi:hypothetical protein
VPVAKLVAIDTAAFAAVDPSTFCTPYHFPFNSCHLCPPLPYPAMVRPLFNQRLSAGAATMSLSLPVAPDMILLSGPPSRGRTLLTALVLAGSGLVAHALRKAPADALRRRLLRRLDKVAPKRRFAEDLVESGVVVNTTCPVCLADFKDSPDRLIRAQKKCKHALCAECMETWGKECLISVHRHLLV